MWYRSLYIRYTGCPCSVPSFVEAAAWRPSRLHTSQWTHQATDLPGVSRFSPRAGAGVKAQSSEERQASTSEAKGSSARGSGRGCLSEAAPIYEYNDNL